MSTNPCACAEDLPCDCEGCQKKDALIRLLYAKIDEIEKALNVSAGINARCVRH